MTAGVVCSLLGQEKQVIPKQIRGIMGEGSFSRIYFGGSRQQAAFSLSLGGVIADAIAGSFVLFFHALEIILGINLYCNDIPETASIVPIAFPLIAGAGTMISLLSLRAEYQVQNIIVAIIFNIIVVYAVLKLSTKIEKILGSGGIFMLLKVFVIKLLAILIK